MHLDQQSRKYKTTRQSRNQKISTTDGHRWTRILREETGQTASQKDGGGKMRIGMATKRQKDRETGREISSRLANNFDYCSTE